MQEREAINSKIARKRQLRLAQQQVEDAQLVTGFFTNTPPGGKLIAQTTLSPSLITNKINADAAPFTPIKNDTPVDIHIDNITPKTSPNVNETAKEFIPQSTSPLPIHVNVSDKTLLAPSIDQSNSTAVKLNSPSQSACIANVANNQQPNMFTSGAVKDFALLQMAIYSLINIHTHLTEQNKYQILGSAKTLIS